MRASFGSVSYSKACEGYLSKGKEASRRTFYEKLFRIHATHREKHGRVYAATPFAWNRAQVELPVFSDFATFSDTKHSMSHGCGLIECSEFAIILLGRN
ncbi:hypothetical protein X975_00261, partial [Stegodyphus mimosarum]